MKFSAPLLKDVKSPREFEVLALRNALRTLSLIEEEWDFDRGGWTFFGHFSLLRLMHAVDCAVRYQDTALRNSINSAFHKLNADIIVGDKTNIVHLASGIAGAIGQARKSKLTNAIQLLDSLDFSNLKAADLHLDDETRADRVSLESHEQQSVLASPLFTRQNGTLPQSSITTIQALQANAWTNAYWKDWYEGVLNGSPVAKELQRRVALIPDEDWEKGPEHIAEEIEKIRAEFLAEKLPLAEKLDLNPETGKFCVTPIPLQNESLIGATLAQVSDALDDALENPANGLNERSRETRVIRRTIERYGNDPQRIEMDFTTVHTGLIRQIAADELPASEENTALIEALREGAQSIRATHPDVAANRETLSKQAFAELSDTQKNLLSKAQPILEDLSEGTLKDDFAEDIPYLLNNSFPPYSAPPLGAPERNPVLAGYAEAQRTLGRSAGMLLLIKRYPDFIKAIEENSAYKTASIVSTLVGVIALGLSIL